MNKRTIMKHGKPLAGGQQALVQGVVVKVTPKLHRRLCARNVLKFSPDTHAALLRLASSARIVTLMDRMVERYTKPFVDGLAQMFGPDAKLVPLPYTPMYLEWAPKDQITADRLRAGEITADKIRIV